MADRRAERTPIVRPRREGARASIGGLGGGSAVSASPARVTDHTFTLTAPAKASARVLRVADLDMLEHDGFPLTWFDVLSRLADAGPAGLRMQELEERSLFSRGGLTRLVDRMGAGLVRREPVTGDRRGIRVVLTTDGRQRHLGPTGLPLAHRLLGMTHR